MEAANGFAADDAAANKPGEAGDAVEVEDGFEFGTDICADDEMYRGWWRLLESADEYMPGRIWWPYYGLELPDELLTAIYRDNAKRLLVWE